MTCERAHRDFSSQKEQEYNLRCKTIQVGMSKKEDDNLTTIRTAGAGVDLSTWLIKICASGDKRRQI